MQDQSSDGSSALDYEKLLKILQDFRVAVVVTRAPDGTLCGRPMAIANRTASVSLSFLTRVDSTTIRDITESPEVVVCMQADNRYLSISGTAKTTRDRKRIRELWTAENTMWFEQGRDDPNLIVLEIVPTYGEYWDRSGMGGVAMRMQELRTILTGHSAGVKVGGEHGDVDF